MTLSGHVNIALTMDGFPSGQRGQTVNLLQIASVVRIHLHPFLYVVRIEILSDFRQYFFVVVDRKMRVCYIISQVKLM